MRKNKIEMFDDFIKKINIGLCRSDLKRAQTKQYEWNNMKMKYWINLEAGKTIESDLKTKTCPSPLKQVRRELYYDQALNVFFTCSSVNIQKLKKTQN